MGPQYNPSESHGLHHGTQSEVVVIVFETPAATAREPPPNPRPTEPTVPNVATTTTAYANITIACHSDSWLASVRFECAAAELRATMWYDYEGKARGNWTVERDTQSLSSYARGPVSKHDRARMRREYPESL